MTPYELNLHIEAFVDRAKKENDDAITTAYLGAYWQRVKKMPDLQKLLGHGKPKKQQTSKEMLEKVRMLNAAFGGMVEGGM